MVDHSTNFFFFYSFWIQIFLTLEQYIQRHGVLREGVRPSVYPYSFDERTAPDWSTREGKKSKNDSWLLSLGCIMRDVICAMVSIGEFRMVLSLHMTSEKLLHGLIRRNTDPLPVLERRSTSTSRTITRTSSSGTHSPMFFEYDDDNYNNGINNGISIDHNSNNEKKMKKKKLDNVRRPLILQNIVPISQ